MTSCFSDKISGGRQKPSSNWATVSGLIMKQGLIARIAVADAASCVAAARVFFAMPDIATKSLPYLRRQMADLPLAEDGTPIYEDSESILEDFMGAGVAMSRLKWHYRSTHESLINFSNVSFYKADLYTFPSIETGTDRYGLQFEYVPDGIYEGKGMNRVEARCVTDAVVRFAKEQLDRQQCGEAPSRSA